MYYFLFYSTHLAASDGKKTKEWTMQMDHVISIIPKDLIWIFSLMHLFLYHWLFLYWFSSVSALLSYRSSFFRFLAHILSPTHFSPVQYLSLNFYRLYLFRSLYHCDSLSHTLFHTDLLSHTQTPALPGSMIKSQRNHSKLDKLMYFFLSRLFKMLIELHLGKSRSKSMQLSFTNTENYFTIKKYLSGKTSTK